MPKKGWPSRGFWGEAARSTHWEVVTDGVLVITLHADDTADVAKRVTIPVVAGQELGFLAIRKIFATGTTIDVSNLVAAR